jgi:hypothetical protein
MPFEKGNQLSAKGRRVEKMLERVIEQNDGQQLRAGLEKVMELFEAGERWAVEYVTDRLDGKAAQTTNVNITKQVRELSDRELIAIASSEGTIIEANSESEPNSVH